MGYIASLRWAGSYVYTCVRSPKEKGTTETRVQSAQNKYYRIQQQKQKRRRRHRIDAIALPASATDDSENHSLYRTAV